MSGYTFSWKEPNPYLSFHLYVDKRIGDEDTGIIAQDVEKLGLPGITTTRSDGIKAVRYERLVPILIQAIKELEARVKTLEG